MLTRTVIATVPAVAVVKIFHNDMTVTEFRFCTSVTPPHKLVRPSRCSYRLQEITKLEFGAASNVTTFMSNLFIIFQWCSSEICWHLDRRTDMPIPRKYTGQGTHNNSTFKFRTGVMNNICRPSSYSFYFSVAHVVTAILNCHSSVNFPGSHTPWSQNSDHKPPFFCGAERSTNIVRPVTAKEAAKTTKI